MRKVYFFLLLLLITACRNQSDTKVISLPHPKVVTPEVLPDELIMQPPLEIKSYGDYLLFTQPMMGKSLLFYNRKTAHQFYWGEIGSGPDDFMSASCIYHNYNDSVIEIYDTNLRKMVSFKTNIENDSISLVSKERFQVNTDSISTLGLHKMDNGYYVSQALFGHENMFVLFDKDLKIIKTFGEKPIREMPDENYSYLYGWFASIGNKLYFASQPTGYLVCYEITEKGNVKKDWDAFFTTPKYETRPAFDWAKDNQQGFYDIQLNDKYLFLSFSGKTFETNDVYPESIVILNHNGELQKHIKLDESHILLKFTLVGDSIYAVAIDQMIKFNWKKEL